MKSRTTKIHKLNSYNNALCQDTSNISGTKVSDDWNDVTCNRCLHKRRRNVIVWSKRNDEETDTFAGFRSWQL
jgi:NDP-sugar pyrophosphorylase family protein